MEENNNLDTSSTEVEKLREIFFRRHAEKVSKGLYDDRDVDKVRSDDHYVSQFIRPRENMEEVSDRINESLRFRLEYAMNDMTEDSFDQWAWEKGAVFFHNCDKDGHSILIIRTKEYRRNMNILPMVKRFFAFALERVYRRNIDEQVVILFDMAEAGLANLDMELVRFVMTCFNTYYPKILAYMLIFEMPWIFNAAWRIIKTWMSPEAVKRIRFVYKNNIQEHIDKDQLFEHMGGTDKYVYKYIPREERSDDDVDKDRSSNSSNKKVTFAETSVYQSFSDENIKDAQTNHSQNNIRRKSRQDSKEDNTFIGRLLTISPAEELEFCLGERERERYGIISLKNTLPYCIAYKVKTTSPEKYRVRPCSGLVQAGSKVDVCVTLQQAFQKTLSKDKFLVMAVEMTDDTVDNVAQLWKTVRKESVMEHRIRCAQSDRNTGGNKDVHQTMIPEDILMQKLNDLSMASHKQERRLNVLLMLQSIVIFLMLGLSVFLYSQYRERVPE